MSEGKNKALTLQERVIIENGIRNGATKSAIARTIGKDKSTVGKEIKLHRVLTQKSGLPRECAAYRRCAFGRQCTADCPEFVPFRCNRRDRSPGACNGCDVRRSCRFNKYTYEAYKAQAAYREQLVDSRSGVNLTTAEAKAIAEVVGPLLAQGLSPYRIIEAHPELGISERTLYNYITNDVFSIAGIKDIDLRRKVSRKLPKKVAKGYKKREDRSFLKGRLYDDYRNYMNEHPNAHVLQMDTVYNDVSNGPFMQTFKFIGLGLMVAVYHDNKTAPDMVDGLNWLEDAVGTSLFTQWAEVVLTDRGSEFSAADALESADGGTTLRTRIFYCDPMQSGQKGSLEVNHEQLRYICPKGTDLRVLGLTCQDALNLAVSHINSAPVESLNGKSPIEYTRFMCPELWAGLEAAGLREIPKDEIILTPMLLKPFAKSNGEL